MKVKYTGKSIATVYDGENRIEMKQGDIAEVSELPKGGSFEQVKESKPRKTKPKEDE